MASTDTPKRTGSARHGVVSDLENLVGYNLKRAYVVLQKDYRAALGDDGLAPRAFSTLSLVVRYPDISQSDLARLLGIERSGLVSIVDDLERQGLLSRMTVPRDRRVQALVATAEGVDTYRATLALVQAHEDRMLADFTAVERSMLMDLLKKIRRSDIEE